MQSYSYNGQLSFLHKLKTKANHNKAPQKSAVELLACHKSVKLLNPKTQRKLSKNSEDSLERKGLDKITATDLERISSDIKFSSPKLPQQKETYNHTSSPKIKLENNSLDNMLEFATKIISNSSSEVDDGFKQENEKLGNKQSFLSLASTEMGTTPSQRFDRESFQEEESDNESKFIFNSAILKVEKEKRIGNWLNSTEDEK